MRQKMHLYASSMKKNRIKRALRAKKKKDLPGNEIRHQWERVRKKHYICKKCTCQRYELNNKKIYTVGDTATFKAPECNDVVVFDDYILIEKTKK